MGPFIERTQQVMSHNFCMVALLVGLAIGSVVPDFNLAQPGADEIKLSSVKGSFVLLMLSPNPADSELVAATKFIKPEGKKVTGFLVNQPAQWQALGISAETKKRTALLVNPAGRLVKEWQNPGADFGLQLGSWLTGYSLPIGYFPPDPRTFFQIEPVSEPGAVGITGNMRGKGLLVLFLSTTGALDNLYGARLKLISEKCKEKGIAAIGLFSDYDEKQESVDVWAKANGIEFACRVDPGSAFADAFRATRTPEVFLLDAKGAVCYTGAIDSSSWERETNRRYLMEAVDALIDGTNMKPNKTIPFGTIIRRSEADDRSRNSGK